MENYSEGDDDKWTMVLILKPPELLGLIACAVPLTDGREGLK
jgi:hypothetical protein